MTHTRLVAASALLAGALLAATGCKKEEAPPPPATTAAPVQVAVPTVKIESAKLALFKPLPAAFESPPDNPSTPEKVELGRQLYWDARLSKNHDVSCNSCHMLDKYGVDNKPVSEGHRKQTGTRNSPTVYNAANHFVQFWDGRAANLEEQAKGPVLNPVEHGLKDEAALLAVINSIPEYVEAFGKAFPEDKPAVTFDNFAKAVAAFERTLITPAPWDAFLKGDKNALTEDQKKGFLAFMDAGCQTCHSGEHLGATMFQRLGSVKPWPDPPEGKEPDLGRYDVTKQDSDKMMFKVPGLRNVAKTAPYYHDGSVEDLGAAVQLMAEHQLGKTLSDENVRLIVAFLESLTGEPTAEQMREPQLPPSTDKTPKPDPT